MQLFGGSHQEDQEDQEGREEETQAGQEGQEDQEEVDQLNHPQDNWSRSPRPPTLELWESDLESSTETDNWQTLLSEI